ncbi:MAG: release factor glutamine methyltransferase [Alphaproteobacteria bacterium]|nr:release factor glutamine methyltransferase [Alphaproteobacteria bacterium]
MSASGEAVLAPGMAIGRARRAVAERLRANGLDTPELDARLLVGHALGLDHRALTVEAARVLTPPETDRLGGSVARRLRHEPVARIIGHKEFWSLPLRITPAVLVPRPETETVVEAALAVVERGAAARIADIGVGSGAILLALLSELPNAMAVGTDRDAAALQIARHNAEDLGLAGRAAFVACDFGAALAGACDLVVSNPPYIATREIATLAPEVRDFDPRGALDGGSDGLTAYRAIATDAPRLLAPGGWLVVEVGIGQAEAVTALFAGIGLETSDPPRRDLAGVPRVVKARYNP